MIPTNVERVVTMTTILKVRSSYLSDLMNTAIAKLVEERATRSNRYWGVWLVGLWEVMSRSMVVIGIVGQEGGGIGIKRGIVGGNEE